MSKLKFQQVIKVAVIAAATSVVINALLFYIFRATGTINDNIFVQPNQPLTIVPVIISSIIPTLIAGLVFFLIEKFTNNGFKIFSIISIVLGLLSLVGPFTAIQGVTTSYAIVLDLMHLVVVGVLLFFINREVNTLKNSSK